jgi:uncharacterized protein YbjT (DUF2867 family)
MQQEYARPPVDPGPLPAVRQYEFDRIRMARAKLFDPLLSPYLEAARTASAWGYAAAFLGVTLLGASWSPNASRTTCQAVTKSLRELEATNTVVLATSVNPAPAAPSACYGPARRTSFADQSAGTSSASGSRIARRQRAPLRIPRPARSCIACRSRFEAVRVAIAGGHGQIALRLAKLLSQGGDEAVALIRNPDHADDVRQAGADPVVVDLEHASEDEVAQAIAGSDAVVFAAGAGPGSGAPRKETMDYGGAVKLITAAKQAGVGRYVIVSSMGANPDAPGDDVFSVYLRAKGRADDAVRASGLDATVVRPGGLTNDPGTGRVRLGESVPRGQVPRDDVAAVLAAVLDSPNTIGRTVDLIGGDTPVAEAVAGI